MNHDKINESTEKIKDAGEKAVDKGIQAAEKEGSMIKEKTSEFVDRSTEVIQNTGEKVKEFGAHAAEKGAEILKHQGEQLRETGETIKHQIQKTPPGVWVVGIGVVAGVLVWTLSRKLAGRSVIGSLMAGAGAATSTIAAINSFGPERLFHSYDNHSDSHGSSTQHGVKSFTGAVMPSQENR